MNDLSLLESSGDPRGRLLDNDIPVTEDVEKIYRTAARQVKAKEGASNN